MKRFIVLFVVFSICSSAVFSQTIKNVYWKSTSENEGNEAVVIAELTEPVNNQFVTIEIFPAGKNESSCAPYAFFEVPVTDGEAIVSWKYQRGILDSAPKKNPKFIAIVRYGTQMEQTKESLEIKLNRISIKNLKWLDERGNAVNKNVMGETVICSADVYGNIDKAIVKIRDVNTGKIKVKVELPVQNNKINLGYIYQWDRIYLKKKPCYVFEIEAPGIEPVQSKPLEVSMKFTKKLVYEDGEPLDNWPYKAILMDGKVIEGKSDKNGMIIIENLIPGEVLLEVN